MITFELMSNDFKIITKDQEYWMEIIKVIFLVKDVGEYDFYLGNNYEYYETGDVWTDASKKTLSRLICNSNV